MKRSSEGSLPHAFDPAYRMLLSVSAWSRRTYLDTARHRPTAVKLMLRATSPVPVSQVGPLPANQLGHPRRMPSRVPVRLTTMTHHLMAKIYLFSRTDNEGDNGRHMG